MIPYRPNLSQSEVCNVTFPRYYRIRGNHALRHPMTYTQTWNGFHTLGFCQFTLCGDGISQAILNFGVFIRQQPVTCGLTPIQSRPM
jgi:hypothetical protein